MKPLILVGGGGHCKSVIEAAVSSSREILGVIDIPQRVGEKVLDFDIIGSDDDISKFVNQGEFIITVGHLKSSTTREKIAAKIVAAGGVFGSVVASTANVSRYATIGAGTVILHGANINAEAVVGENVIVNTLGTVDHSAVVGDFCHISAGALVSGDCIVDRYVFVGAHAVLFTGITVKERSVVAAGAYVRKSIPERGIYIGNPAKLMAKL